MTEARKKGSTMKTVSREEFRASPDHYVREAQMTGPIAVVDGSGAPRMILSSPLADEDSPPK